MNLGKLLVAGKCFFGGGDAATYRLNKRLCLPKFNEGKNPFAPQPAEPAATAPKVESNPPAPAVPAARKSPPAYAFKPAASPVAQPGAKPVRSGWTSRLNPFRPPEPAASPGQPPAAVQVELSLDAVKVVHNDLADADVEIVPVKSRADASVTTALLPPARQAWEYLGETLLKST
jgi:hypothetical protein